MARSKNGHLTAAERFERKRDRQGRPDALYRRTSTRRDVVRRAVEEG